MKKLLYASLTLFVVWFASTACFPIYVNTPTRPVTPPEPTATPCVPDSQSTAPCGIPVPGDVSSSPEQVG